jgi:hypothetical protein
MEVNSEPNVSICPNSSCGHKLRIRFSRRIHCQYCDCVFNLTWADLLPKLLTRYAFRLFVVMMILVAPPLTLSCITGIPFLGWAYALYLYTPAMIIGSALGFAFALIALIGILMVLILLEGIFK